ncbi:MAG TPA: PAS domain-containing protein, partial [Flavisolibacter sp.]|nr:PAS domain-containing protein [Flavisolibacter sp.]
MDKSVTLYVRSQQSRLNGIWNWEMSSPAVYCSDVMSFPDHFVGTKGLIHPDDLPKLMGILSLMEEKEVPRLDFRIITTYGEVKTISGQRISIEDEINKEVEPIPGKELWEEALQLLTVQKENDFLKLRNDLTEYTERLHGIGSWLINKQTGQVWYSDNVFRIYGLAPQSLNAHANAFNQFIHKDDRMTVLDAFEKAYLEEAPLHIEYRIVSADGTLRYIQQITKWFYSITGQKIFSGIVRDVTAERAIAEELLADQTQVLLHQQILKISEQQTATGYWLTNLTSRKTSYSENYYRIYGFKQPFLPSYNSFINLVHSDDRARVREHIEKMYNEHALSEIEFRIIRPDGKQRYIRQSGKLFVSPNRELIMIGLVQDVSVQKGLEKKILELNEDISLNKAVTEMAENTLEISSFIWLPDGYMQWSDGFYRMLGYKPGGQEPLPRFLYKNIHPADLKIFKDAEALLLNHQSHDDIIVRLISRGSMRKVRISFRQVNYGKDATIALVHDISKQDELSEQFANNKLFTELLNDSVNDMVLFTNVDNTILYWNKVAEKKAGIEKQDALYHNLFDVLPQLNEESFLGQLQFAIRGHEGYSTRVSGVYLKWPHDYWLWPLKNEAGEVEGVLHVIQDISKQLELQQQLNERLNFIENLVESSVDRIVVLDRFMNYLYWNRKAEEYYAINKERVLGKNILEIFPSFRNHVSYSEFRKVLKGETIYLPATQNGESEEYFETYLTPIKDETGDVTAVLWIVHDLSSEYQLTKEREQTSRLLHTTMDAVTDMIEVFETVRDENDEIIDFRFVLLNHEAEKWIPDAVGKTLLQLLPGVVQEGIFDTYKKVVETGIPDQSELYYAHEQFNGWFYHSVVKLNDGVATTTRDITIRKKAEEEILRLKDEVAQKATDKYYSLFNSIDEGFCLVEVILDNNGKPVDLLYLEANEAYQRKTGLG